MSPETLAARLRSLLTEVGNLPPDFPASANLYLDLGVPSVKAMQLLMDLEAEFAISIPDEEFVEAGTLDQLQALIERLQAGGQ